MPNEEINREEAMLHAINYMRRFTKKELRDENKMRKDVKHEERDSKKHNLEKEAKDVEHVEKDIYKFLYHNIRVMRSLIEIEKDQDFVENAEHLKNPYKGKIANEVSILLRELRRIGALDNKTS